MHLLSETKLLPMLVAEVLYVISYSFLQDVDPFGLHGPFLRVN